MFVLCPSLCEFFFFFLSILKHPAVLLCRLGITRHWSERLTLITLNLNISQLAANKNHQSAASGAAHQYADDYVIRATDFMFSLTMLGLLQGHQLNIQLSAGAFPCVSLAVNTTALSNYEKWTQLVSVGNDFFLTHLCQTNEATSKTPFTCRHCDAQNNASRCNRQDVMPALWQSGASQ